uniref:Uncharacterized protein n=1 Tax=Hyaloperonospora arabidopsidis (strain Emoy2) TaxID=559515 RepID=M4BML3_HYAAE
MQLKSLTASGDALEGVRPAYGDFGPVRHLAASCTRAQASTTTPSAAPTVGSSAAFSKTNTFTYVTIVLSLHSGIRRVSHDRRSNSFASATR